MIRLLNAEKKTTNEYLGSKIYSMLHYQSKYYSQRYIEKWARNVVPEPMKEGMNFRSFGVKISNPQETIYIEDSYDLIEENGTNLVISEYSYINRAWENWCRKNYGSYHNTWVHNGEKIIGIDDARLNFTNVHMTKKSAFVICWHKDHSNYWHYTFDACYRLFLLAKAYGEDYLRQIDYIVIGRKLKKFQRDILKAIMGYEPEINYYEKGVKILNAINIPITNESFIDLERKKEYADMIARGFIEEEQKLLNSKLYIERGETKNGRNILNEIEVIEMLEKRGFKKFNPGCSDLSEQVRKFREATMIIGAHGSAFVNTLYSDKSNIIELVDVSYDPIHDYIISRGKDVGFLRVKSGAQQKYELNRSVHKDFICDLEKLERALSLFD